MSDINYRLLAIRTIWWTLFLNKETEYLFLKKGKNNEKLEAQQYNPSDWPPLPINGQMNLEVITEGDVDSVASFHDIQGV